MTFECGWKKLADLMAYWRLLENLDPPDSRALARYPLLLKQLTQAATSGSTAPWAEGAAHLALEHFVGLSGKAAHIASKDGINLACDRGGEFALYKFDSRLRRFLCLFLANASLLHDYINEFVHPDKYGTFILEQLFPPQAKFGNWNVSNGTNQLQS
jgi:hypothetical protein